MVFQQKEAIFNILTCIVAALLYIFIYPSLGMSKDIFAFLFYAILILTMFTYRLIIRKGKDSTVLDERDLAIRYRSVMNSAGIAWSYLIVICLIFFYKYHEAGLMPVHYMAVMVYYGGIISYLSWSISTLLLYGKGI